MRLSHIVGTMILLASLCTTAASSQAKDADQYQALKQFSQVLDLIDTAGLQRYPAPAGEGRTSFKPRGGPGR